MRTNEKASSSSPEASTTFAPGSAQTISTVRRRVGGQTQESVPIDDRNIRTVESGPVSVHIRKLMFKSTTPSSYLAEGGEMEINVYASIGGVELMSGCGTLSVETARELVSALSQAIDVAERLVTVSKSSTAKSFKANARAAGGVGSSTRRLRLSMVNQRSRIGARPANAKRVSGGTILLPRKGSDMTEYSKMWEEVRRIRARLGEIVPGMKTESLGQAMRIAKIHESEIGELLIQWAVLEESMKTASD
jgi:hypothetical protein